MASAPALCGCRSVKYLSLPQVTTDVSTERATVADSVYVSDTVRQINAGDTVWLTHTRTVYRQRLVHDTVQHLRTDSIVVERHTDAALSRWQRCKISYGGWAMALLAAAALFYLRRWR